MEMKPIKRGRPTMIDYDLVDEDGLFVPGNTSKKRENKARLAREWARRNDKRFTVRQQEDGNGKRVGILIQLIPWVWVCKHHGQGDKPLCNKCVREDGNLAGGEFE